MANTYLFFVILLFALAIFDLVVGVSNDAVNFLNSALGSKVARRRTILWIASAGIFLGAALSSGMMEVARKGVFHPEAFVFEEIMVIFLAVMLTDIILLDLFNTFGMPTSTTVSIVFELLGAAVAVALIKMTEADMGLSHLSTYINGENALTIVSGILLSVLFAFTLGALVMFLSRLIFSFQVKQKLKWSAPLWGAFAMAAMSYFLFVKGLKNVDFVSKLAVLDVGADELELCGKLKNGKYSNCGGSAAEGYHLYLKAWIQQNTLWVSLALFAFWAIVLKAVQAVSKANVLRFVVLFGTFALAMAFAGNDLVNFIGVPIAGFESYLHWADAGMPEGMSMEFLSSKIKTDPLLLVLAGGIMVLTLWFSKKARSVTETEIKLGRQDEGGERFRPNAFSRGVVRGARAVNRVFVAVLPAGLGSRLSTAFAPVEQAAPAEGEVAPAFDLVRASVNLAVASMIISFASSRKLPLSTTYVSFMVAMGASLADRAWGRDSAVYRIAGVASVVLGWFGTALIAFTVAAVFASLIFHFQLGGVIALALLAVGLVVRSSIVHRRRAALKAAKEEAEFSRGDVVADQVLSQTRSKAVEILKQIQVAMEDVFQGLFREDPSKAKAARKRIHELQEQNEAFRFGLFHYLKRIKQENHQSGKKYLLVFDHEQDMINSAGVIVDAAASHVENVHSPLIPQQVEVLSQLQQDTATYFGRVQALVAQPDPVSPEALAQLKQEKRALIARVETFMDAQSLGIREGDFNSRNSLLAFNIAFNLRDLLAISARFAALFREG